MAYSSLDGRKVSVSAAVSLPPMTTSTMSAMRITAYISFAGERKMPFI